jgi:hypothetical protein
MLGPMPSDEALQPGQGETQATSSVVNGITYPGGAYFLWTPSATAQVVKPSFDVTPLNTVTPVTEGYSSFGNEVYEQVWQPNLLALLLK